MHLPVKFTTKIEEFIAYNGPKFSYAPQALGKEFHIQSHKILYQQGIKEQDIKVTSWGQTPIFFQTQNSSIPFDIFAASFYLLSRYEEYLLHQLDEHQRYDYRNSLLFQQNVLEKPIIEIWVEHFKNVLSAKFPEMKFPASRFYFEPLVNVSMATLYKHKAFLRNFFGGINDFLHLRLRSHRRRILVHYFGKKDPYDTFDEILELKKKHKHSLTFFHLLAPYSSYDHNISRNKDVYKTQIKYLADYADTGILTSYYAMGQEDVVKKEIKSLEEKIHRSVEKSRAHFNRIKFPTSYQILNEMELKKDYSMGYNNRIGFRAGTSIPFPFYDIENETETALLLHPVILSDVMLKYQYHLSPKKALKTVIETGETVRKYGGHFYPVFHNFVLSDMPEWRKWNGLYVETIKHFSTDKKMERSLKQKIVQSIKKRFQ